MFGQCFGRALTPIHTENPKVTTELQKFRSGAMGPNWSADTNNCLFHTLEYPEWRCPTYALTLFCVWSTCMPWPSKASQAPKTVYRQHFSERGSMEKSMGIPCRPTCFRPTQVPELPSSRPSSYSALMPTKTTVNRLGPWPRKILYGVYTAPCATGSGNYIVRALRQKHLKYMVELRKIQPPWPMIDLDRP